LEPKYKEKKVLPIPATDVRDMEEEKVHRVIESQKGSDIEEQAKYKVEAKAHNLCQRIKHLLMKDPDIGRC
jgi:hypothetical protein